MKRKRTSDPAPPSGFPSNTHDHKLIHGSPTELIRRPILELSSQNLREFSKMSQSERFGYPITPQGSRTTSTTTASLNAESPSRRSKSQSQYNLDPGQLMEKHYIYGPDKGEESLSNWPEFSSMIQDIVNVPRESTMKPESVNKFRQRRKDLAHRNEATLMTGMMPALIKNSRTIQTIDGPLLRDWDDDHIDMNIDLEFTRNSVPIADTAEDAILSKLLEKTSGMKNPKPDITYGLSRNAFSRKELNLADHHMNISGLSPGILYPFLIIEWKSAKGNFEQGRHQAQRAGAAMVHATRQFLAQAPPNSPSIIPVSDASAQNPDASTDHSILSPPPDSRLIAFSIVISPLLAHVYAHWCEQLPEDAHLNGTFAWQMSKIAGFQADDIADIRRLRSTINNILDWGLLQRVEMIRRALGACGRLLLQGEALMRSYTKDDRGSTGGERLVGASEVEEEVEKRRGKRRRV